MPDKPETCSYDPVIIELLKDSSRSDLLNMLPKCNCFENMDMARKYRIYSDVIYHWVCPVHGKQIDA
jgi:hypothetical protein